MKVYDNFESVRIGDEVYFSELNAETFLICFRLFLKFEDSISIYINNELVQFPIKYQSSVLFSEWQGK